MGKITRVTLVIGLVNLLCMSAYSELSEVDLFQEGDALLTRDSATNLEWLDVTYVKGGSRISAEIFLSGEGGALGFRYAKQSEIATLCNSAGIPHASTEVMWWTTNFAGIQRLQSLLGVISSTGIGSPLSGGPYGPLTIGIADYDITPAEPLYSPLVSLEIWTAQHAGRATLYDGNLKNTDGRNIGVNNLGHYLVRERPSAPPPVVIRTPSGIPTTDIITHGTDSISISFVSIGLKGNAAGYFNQGAVDHNFRIGRNEVTADQWAFVLNADPRAGSFGPNTYTGSVPADTSWYEAAKFCNWLTTGDVYKGVYSFDTNGTFTGMDRSSALRDHAVVYALPTVDEWYKAAYFKADGSGYTLYASGNSVPLKGAGGENYLYGAGGYPWEVGAGIRENNGTYDMNGNYQEWLEDNFRFCGGEFRGDDGSMSSTTLAGYTYPQRDGSFTGFRVVAISTPRPLIQYRGMTGQMQLEWNTSSGLIYQVQCSTNLLSTNWFNLNEITAAGTNSLLVDPINDVHEKFYRIISK